MSLSTAQPAAHRPRLLPLCVALAAFAVLFALAHRLGFDATILGISDSAVRPVAHVLVYGILALLLARGLGNRFAIAWLATLALATAEELHQLFIPGRYATLTDWACNAAGATMFLLIAAALHQKRPRPATA